MRKMAYLRRFRVPKWRRGWDSKSPFTVFFIGFMALNRLCVCLPQPLLSWLSQHKNPNPAKCHHKENVDLRESFAVTVRPHVRSETSSSFTKHSPTHTLRDERAHPTQYLTLLDQKPRPPILT